MRLPATLLPLLLLFLNTSLTSAASHSKIKLSSIRQLTLRQGAKTTGRRHSPIPQLKCVGGDAKGLYEVDVMRCKNMGSDYGDDDVSWACTADVPKWFKLGSTDVLCEGWSGPDDPYVLKGSCGVEYRLMLTDAGYERYGNNPLRGFKNKLGSEGGTDWSALIFWVIFFSVLGWIIYSACTGAARQNVGRRPGWNGGGGGGPGPFFGGGGDNDPPPPYSKFAPGSTQQQQWRPGFWSGLAAGAAGSYLMNQNRERQRSRYASPMYGGGGGTLFGEGSDRFGASPAFSSDDHGEGSSRVSTTGYGQTRRR